MRSLRHILEKKTPIIDVRTPAEFTQGHIPNAVNIPLFSNEERHEVGICYKQKGKENAVRLGLEFVGPKLNDIVSQTDKLIGGKEAVVHCWRGGMRSQSMAWLLSTAGYSVQTIEGGYKTWRRLVLETIDTPMPLICLGGKTGSGKTEILKSLERQGESIIDLECFANHKGSAFGGQGAQPTNEHFENLLAYHVLKSDQTKIHWVEDESRNIGKVYIPTALKKQMNEAALIIINWPFKHRVDKLCDQYGQISHDELKADFEKIRKRMGGQHVKAAKEALDNGDIETACALALTYYDKAYDHSLERSGRSPRLVLDAKNESIDEIAKQLIEWKNQNLHSIAKDQVVDVK